MKNVYLRRALLGIKILGLILYNDMSAYGQWCTCNNIDVQFGTPLQAVQTMLGNSGIQVSNCSFATGSSTQQIGTFTGAGFYIGINNGLILATGDARLAETINRISSGGCYYTDATLADGTTQTITQSFKAEWPYATGHYDADLDQLGQGNPYHAAVLEFDFVPGATAVSFRFVFASDEYPEYVSQGFFDVFGFFVGGPGISGPYSNNAVNIALVPGTNQPISVGTINANVNAQYYIENICSSTCPPGCCPCPNPDFQYDAYTTVLTASISGLECTGTYHLKLGIANINDAFVGSAVFIEAGSFNNNFAAGPASVFPQTVCEGENITLSVAGDSTYQYTWKDSAGAVIGTTQNLVLPATVNGPPYTVTVTQPGPGGCTNPFQVNPTVNVLANAKPYTKGINDNYDFEYYVPAGAPFSFNIYSYDAENENITPTIINFPVGLGYTLNSNYNILGYSHPFYAISGAINTQGIYIFQITLEDDNSCGEEQETYTFKIIVVCPDCPGSIYYERRGLYPALDFHYLPPITETPGNIVAGYNVSPTLTDGNVYVIPSRPTEFYAGNSIQLQPGFIVEPGAWFKAEIREDLCDNDCDDCCDEQAGFEPTFTAAEIPNVFSPNGDGQSDYWYVPDPDHSNCAFGIMGFHLTVYNRWGNIVHDIEHHAENCCEYKAPGLYQPNLQFSSIYWDGHVNYPTPGGPMVSGGTYDYVLTLYGCNEKKLEFTGFITVIGVP